MGPDLLETPKSLEDVKDGIVRVYLNYVAYCRELGVEFMAGYYDTKNQALNPAIRTERPYPIVTVQAYVEQAAKDGIINVRESIDEFTTDIRMIVIGNVFEWCLREGNADFEGNMSRSLRRYLDSTLEEVDDLSLYCEVRGLVQGLARCCGNSWNLSCAEKESIIRFI